MVCGVGKREREAEMSWVKFSLSTGIMFSLANKIKIKNVEKRGENCKLSTGPAKIHRRSLQLFNVMR